MGTVPWPQKLCIQHKSSSHPPTEGKMQKFSWMKARIMWMGRISVLSWAGSAPLAEDPCSKQALGERSIGDSDCRASNWISCMVMFISDAHRQKDIKAQSSQRHSTQGLCPVQAAPCEQPLCSTCSPVALTQCSGWFVLVEPNGVATLLKLCTIHTRAVVYKPPIRCCPQKVLPPGLDFRWCSLEPYQGLLWPLGSRGVCPQGLALPAARFFFLAFHSKSSGLL